MKIRKSTEKDFAGMMEVAKRLYPTWFDKTAINESMPVDLKIHKGYIAEEDGKIVGFITYTSDKGKIEISWIGIDPNYQRRGIGSKLLKRLESGLRQIGVKELRVKTVAESTIYKPYDQTRAFYRKMGFEVEKVEKVWSKDTGKEFDLATFVKKL
ncbi:MAG: GNAT family N-acetyltransferase [Candidatus Aenigmarchaeota archaeon]|nr:GNAT family N-acetyltransferase [Candidatus Aenigmarchaeota archaeon]